jgi:hypothetical protein
MMLIVMLGRFLGRGKLKIQNIQGMYVQTLHVFFILLAIKAPTTEATFEL